jgi:hypothetical protein
MGVSTDADVMNCPIPTSRLSNTFCSGRCMYICMHVCMNVRSCQFDNFLNLA